MATTACTGDDSGGGGDVDGRAFWSTSVERGGVPAELVPGTRIEISFSDGSIGASAGCNSMGGSYQLVGATLEVGDLFTTEMGCDPPRHDQDRFVADFLMANPTLTLAGDELTLSTADATIEFVDRVVADPDRALSGTRWVTNGFVQGDVAMSMPAPGEAGWIEFGEDSNMTAFDSCIHLEASVEIDDHGGSGQVRFGEITSPDAAFTSCMVNEYMTAFNAVFATGEATWEIDGHNLTIIATDGNGVTFASDL